MREVQKAGCVESWVGGVGWEGEGEARVCAEEGGDGPEGEGQMVEEFKEGEEREPGAAMMVVSGGEKGKEKKRENI